MDLSRVIERWAGHFPAKVALHFHGVGITYAELWRRIEHAAARLDVAPGDRVAYLGYNSPEVLVLLFALARRGAMLVPLNWRLTAAEHRELLADCAPRQLFCDAEFRAHAEQLGVPLGNFDAVRREAAAGDDAAGVLIAYTSGTTGKPKGAVLTQAALLWNAFNSIHAHDLSQADHVLSALPLFHVGGLNNQTLPALVTGASVTLHKRFEPGLWLHDVAARRPTLSLLVPATMAAVSTHADWQATDLSSLRLL